MSVIVDIAEAVKNELNGHHFSQSFTAVRTYLPVYELKDMGTLHVTVVPKSRELQLETRRDVRRDYEIDIAVQKRFSADTAAEIDPLMTLVEEITDFFVPGRMTSYPAAVCFPATNNPVYSPAHMRRMRQFTSVVTLTFRVVS